MEQVVGKMKSGAIETTVPETADRGTIRLMEPLTTVTGVLSLAKSGRNLEEAQRSLEERKGS